MRQKIKLVGAGGVWQVLGERADSSVVRQLNSLSCVAATGEMLLRARGITHITQAEIVAIVGAPSDVVSLAQYFNSLKVSGNGWRAGGFDIKSFPAVLKLQNWGAVLREGSPLGHLVMVEEMDEKGLLKIKDPFDQTSYRMTKQELLKHLSEIIVELP